MLKASKLSHHKSHKSSKDSSMRKSHLSKKSLHSRSPGRLSGSSRPPPMKHISPGMKRGPPVGKRKASHSPRMRSIASPPRRSLSHRSKQESPVSIDRVHAMKTLKYDKRKQLSNSPVRHMSPSSPHRPMLPRDSRSVNPYVDTYPSTSIHPPQYSPPRKKIQREAVQYFAPRSVSPLPPRRHMIDPLHSDGNISHRAVAPPVSHSRQQRNIPLGHGEREKHVYDLHKHHESPGIPSSRAKDIPVKVSYGTDSRYRSPSPVNRYLPSGSKSYGPTLHERFSSVIDHSEPRVRYSREDLEKITIKRNLREPSPTPRHMMNPSNIKLVRRGNESHRPIFDREEIKQASKNLHENVYYENKTSSYGAARPIEVRETQNYPITRHKYDSHHHDTFQSGGGRSLNERWPAHDGKKGLLSLDRDEREKDYDRVPVSKGYINSRSRSRSGDRDFRSERYLESKPSSSRTDYVQRPPMSSVEHRNSIPYSHKSSLPVDARHKLNIRKNDRENHSRPVAKDHYLSSDRHYPEPVLSSRVDRRDHPSPVSEQHKWDYKSRSSSREKISDYPRRPDRYSYKPWGDKPDISTKSTSYLEHESREGSSSFRGSSRPFRSSRGGFRSRGFRGPLRGSSMSRGSYRGGYRNSSSPRARGFPRR